MPPAPAGSRAGRRGQSPAPQVGQCDRPGGERSPIPRPPSPQACAAPRRARGSPSPQRPLGAVGGRWGAAAARRRASEGWGRWRSPSALCSGLGRRRRAGGGSDGLIERGRAEGGAARAPCAAGHVGARRAGQSLWRPRCGAELRGGGVLHLPHRAPWSVASPTSRFPPCPTAA